METFCALLALFLHGMGLLYIIDRLTEGMYITWDELWGEFKHTIEDIQVQNFKQSLLFICVSSTCFSYVEDTLQLALYSYPL